MTGIVRSQVRGTANVREYRLQTETIDLKVLGRWLHARYRRSNAAEFDAQAAKVRAALDEIAARALP